MIDNEDGSKHIEENIIILLAFADATMNINRLCLKPCLQFFFSQMKESKPSDDDAGLYYCGVAKLG